MYPTKIPWGPACTLQLRCSPVPPAVRAVHRPVTIGNSELCVLDVDQVLAFYAYELAFARIVVAAGRCRRGEVRLFRHLENLSPFRRDLCGDVREVRFEK